MVSETQTQPSASMERYERLRAAVRGMVLQPGDSGYEAATAVYNGMIHRHPALIARCADVVDVVVAVAFAREQELLLAVRGGGHSGAGLGTCDDGLVIDLSPMRDVRVDPEACTVRIGGGGTLGDIDHATQPFGLAAPIGINSTTGIGGLTLGGGLGHLTRRFGLTIDDLIEADMVLADGSFVTVNKDKHPDLYWAIRGGGGNFGVVTSFLLRLHPVPSVVAGPTLWPLEESGEVLAWYRTFMPNAPRELNGIFAYLKVPPYAPYPPDLAGTTMCAVIWCYSGPVETAADVLAPALQVGHPVSHFAQPMPLARIQSAMDALYPRGDQWYWKADFFRELSDEAIAIHQEYGPRIPSLQSRMHLFPIDGAVHDIAADATAWSYRDV
jgi:hypothetical protein